MSDEDSTLAAKFIFQQDAKTVDGKVEHRDEQAMLINQIHLNFEQLVSLQGRLKVGCCSLISSPVKYLMNLKVVNSNMKFSPKYQQVESLSRKL